MDCEGEQVRGEGTRACYLLSPAVGHIPASAQASDCPPLFFQCHQAVGGTSSVSWVYSGGSAAWLLWVSGSPVGSRGGGCLWRWPLPDLLALKLLSKLENRGGDGKEEVGSGKGVALWAEGLAQPEEAGYPVDRLFYGLAG